MIIVFDYGVVFRERGVYDDSPGEENIKLYLGSLWGGFCPEASLNDLCPVHSETLLTQIFFCKLKFQTNKLPK